MSPKKSQESGLVPAIARPHDGRNKGDYGKVPRKKRDNCNIENLDVVTGSIICGQSRVTVTHHGKRKRETQLRYVS